MLNQNIVTGSFIVNFLELSNLKQRLIRKQYYAGDWTLVAEILQAEQGITYADDEKPVLATGAIGPCVAVIAYNPILKLGLMTHYDDIKNSQKNLKKLDDKLCELTKGVQDYDYWLVGGWDCLSEPLIANIYQYLHFFARNNFTIQGQDILQVKVIRAVALDTRDGKLYSYYQELNPYARQNFINENI